MSMRSESSAASAAAPAARRGGSRSLEQFQNVVTPTDEFTLLPCGCDCWFCPRCCSRKGFNLRARLVPILQTFKSCMMLSLTVDPALFPSPRDAYLYLRERRAISRTMQDLWRWQCLHSRRYAYVLEFQRDTEQPHFHVLGDATYIDHALLVAAWGKHRPASAGPTAPGRPELGYCWISKPRFQSPLHAARYATKYLVKAPAQGFPGWVLAMGAQHRVPRFQTSRRFWGTPSEPRSAPQSMRRMQTRSYSDRLADCGTTINMFQTVETIDTATGTLSSRRHWRARLGEPADLLASIGLATRAGVPRATLRAATVHAALNAIAAAAGRTIRVIHGGGGE